MAVPLHRVQFSLAPSTHLDIEWTKGEGEPIVGSTPITSMASCERETAPDEYALRGVPAICWGGWLYAKDWDNLHPWRSRTQYLNSESVVVEVTEAVGWRWRTSILVWNRSCQLKRQADSEVEEFETVWPPLPFARPRRTEILTGDVQGCRLQSPHDYNSPNTRLSFHIRS